MTDISEYRREFPIFDEALYLNSCSLGALNIRSRSYVEKFLHQWNGLGASAWYTQWMEDLDSVRTMLARLLGADEEEIGLGHSISSLLGSVASCFPWADRKNVVVTDLDFPTANYQWLAKEGAGVTTTVLESSDSIGIRLDQFRDAVDESTAVVSTSHVFFTSGKIQDIAAINASAREKGAVCIIDAYQSVGQIPIAVHAAGVDILVSGGLKWLLGGPGITFLYARKGLLPHLHPSSTGWFGMKDQFCFPPREFEFHESARRFETGTPSMASVCALKGGLEIVLEIGVDTVHSVTKALTEELIDRLEKNGFTLKTASNPDERSAIVMIYHPDAPRVVKALGERNIIVDYRGEYVRVSPYFYNTSGDIKTFVSTLSSLL